MSATLADLGTVAPDLTKNAVQRAFIACNSRFQNFSGGFGSGKTTACNLKAQIISSIMPNNMGVICRKTYPDLRDTTRKSFFEILTPDWVKNWKESENALTLKNNSVILFRHFENGSIKVGSSLGWFFIDQAEEAEEQIFKALVGRLRRNVPRRYGLLAMNPNGQDWQYRLFVKKAGPNYAHFDSTTFDNQANLPVGYIEDMMSTFPQEWIERFVYGKWNKMSGLIFHEFDEDRHLIDPFPIPDNWVRCRGLDWGVDAPATCLFVAQAPNGRYYVFDEYGDSEKTPEEHADAILEQSRPYGNFRGSIIDSTAFHRDQDLKSVADRYRARGLHCLPATKDLMARILLVKQLLKTDQISFFRGKTERTVGEMKSWKWGARTQGKEIPARGNDHYLDGFGYVTFWMDRKNFYHTKVENELEVAQRRERLDGFLTKYTGPSAGQSDPVTGLPA